MEGLATLAPCTLVDLATLEVSGEVAVGIGRYQWEVAMRIGRGDAGVGVVSADLLASHSTGGAV